MILLLLACASSETASDHAVRATLEDGQVLTGSVGTELLQLETGMGLVQVPIRDVGEVEPVEGGDLGGSGGHVTVWLRNGSELRGRWAEPELAMGIAVGGQDVAVDLPMNQLQRFQLQDGQYWPEGAVFRVATDYGDDFLVDPETTTFEIENDLGVFAPFLSECASVEPLENGDWRVELLTGTVLIGPLTEDTLTLALPMGPDTVTVPLDRLVSIDREDWGSFEDNWSRYANENLGSYAPAEEIQLRQDTGAGNAPRPARSTNPSGWYENSMQKDLKRR